MRNETPKASPAETPDTVLKDLHDLRGEIEQKRTLQRGAPERIDRLNALASIRQRLTALQNTVQDLAQNREDQDSPIDPKLKIANEQIYKTIVDVDTHIDEAKSSWHAFLERWNADFLWEWGKGAASWVKEIAKPAAMLAPVASVLEMFGAGDWAKAIRTLGSEKQPPANLPPDLKIAEQQAAANKPLIERMDKIKALTEAIGLNIDFGTVGSYKKFLSNLEAAETLYQRVMPDAKPNDLLINAAKLAKDTFGTAKIGVEQFRQTMQQISTQTKPAKSPTT